MILILQKETLDIKISTSKLAFDLLVEALSMMDEIDQDKELFFVIGLKRNNKPNYVDVVSIGNLTSTIVTPREVFRRAVTTSTHALIIAHNHVSGELNPSEQDKGITKRLVQAGKIIDIQIIDHIVFHPAHGHYSFADEGML